MRILALIPLALSLTALILTFLALFAGHKQSFMQDYDIITLNTSQIGTNVFNTTSSSSSNSNSIVTFLDDLSNSLKDSLNSNLNSLAQTLGLHDFYSAHLLNHCQGFYAPAALANETLSPQTISRNVTRCSDATALYTFDPKDTLQRQLDASGLGVDLDDLRWPAEIDEGLGALRVAQKAGFVLYCVAAAFIGLAAVTSGVGVFWGEGRVGAGINVVVGVLAFVAVGVASGVVTAVAVKAAELVNFYGNDVGVRAERGGEFLAVTWAATALMLLSLVVWCFECVKGRRRQKGTGYGTEKRLP
ncbi:hypothetical protein MBLNU230_g6244t1 [Neophaeotheca triangularis]